METLRELIDESNAEVQRSAAAYAKAIAERDVVAAFHAAQALSVIADATVAMYVILCDGVVGVTKAPKEPEA